MYTRRRQFNLLDPRHGWRQDESMRVECWSESVNDTCCHHLNIVSAGAASEWQPDKGGFLTNQKYPKLIVTIPLIFSPLNVLKTRLYKIEF